MEKTYSGCNLYVAPCAAHNRRMGTQAKDKNASWYRTAGTRPSHAKSNTIMGAPEVGSPISLGADCTRMEAFIRTAALSSWSSLLNWSHHQLTSSFYLPPSAKAPAHSHESYQRLRLLPLRLAASALHPDVVWCRGLKGEDPIKKALAECTRQLGESTATGVPLSGGRGEQDSWRPGVREPEEADAEQVQPDTELAGVGHDLWANRNAFSALVKCMEGFAVILVFVFVLLR